MKVKKPNRNVLFSYENKVEYAHKWRNRSNGRTDLHCGNFKQNPGSPVQIPAWVLRELEKENTSCDCLATIVIL